MNVKTSKTLNIVLIVIIILLVCSLLGISIYQKVNEKKSKTYSQAKVVEIYNSIKYDDKMNIYLFYGDGCPHCKKEVEFFKNIGEEYKEKYNLYSFETWDDVNNQQLKKLVIDKLKEEGKLTGSESSNMTMDQYYSVVPFLVIGDKYIIGYNETIGDDIKTNIDNEKDSNYDIMKKIDLK